MAAPDPLLVLEDEVVDAALGVLVSEGDWVVEVELEAPSGEKSFQFMLSLFVTLESYL